MAWLGLKPPLDMHSVWLLVSEAKFYSCLKKIYIISKHILKTCLCNFDTDQMCFYLFTERKPTHYILTY